MGAAVVMLSGKWILALGLATVLLAVVSVYATLRITAPTQTTPITSSDITPQLQLTLELGKTRFTVGEPVSMVVSLQNISNETITVYFAYKGGWAEFMVFDENNTLVLDYPGSHWAAIDALTMLPNEMRRRTFTWNQIDLNGTQVPKGTYRISGTTQKYGFSLEYGPWIGILETPAIAITIEY